MLLFNVNPTIIMPIHYVRISMEFNLSYKQFCAFFTAKVGIE